MTTTEKPVEAILIERTLNAPIERVWKALTDVNEMRNWYFDLKEFQAKIGFEFEFVVEHEGMKYHHLCRVTEVIPQKKIAYTWRYKGEKGDSLVTFELLPKGNKTQLCLRHEGLETFPRTPAYARKNFETGWNAMTAELEGFLQSKKADKLSVEIERFINAPRDRVYAAWTDPEQMKRWFGPQNVQTNRLKVEPRPGGEFRWDLTNSDGETMTMRGEFRELQPGRKVVFTWKWEDDEVWENHISTVTVELSDKDGGTHLRLVHEQLPNDQSRDGHNAGWNSALDKLERFLIK